MWPPREPGYSGRHYPQSTSLIIHKVWRKGTPGYPAASLHIPLEPPAVAPQPGVEARNDWLRASAPCLPMFKIMHVDISPEADLAVCPLCILHSRGGNQLEGMFRAGWMSAWGYVVAPELMRSGGAESRGGTPQGIRPTNGGCYPLGCTEPTNRLNFYLRGLRLYSLVEEFMTSPRRATADCATPRPWWDVGEMETEVTQELANPIRFGTCAHEETTRAHCDCFFPGS